VIDRFNKICEKQPGRQFGVFAVLGRTSIEVMRLQRAHIGPPRRTGLLPFSWDASNAGFQVGQ
jgi:hypothetical protein